MVDRKPTTRSGFVAAADVLSDRWSMLLLRDIARGSRRFEQLLSTGISRKILAARLLGLVEAGVLVRHRYQERPDRYGYHLSPRGHALLPALVALQEWGDTWLLGDTDPGADVTPAEARRLETLVGTVVAPLVADPLEPDLLRGPVAWTAVFCCPGTGLAARDGLTGGPGSEALATSFRDRSPELADLGARVVGVSTQSQVELDAFARAHRIWFALVSDADLGLAAALGLPTFRLGGAHRLKGVVLVVDEHRVVRSVVVPGDDGPATVEDTVAAVVRLCSAGTVDSGEVEVHDVQPDEPVGA